MVSQRKKKLQKQSDFHKPKLKVGKTLPKNLNVTKIDFQTKRLVIKSQLKTGKGDTNVSVDKKKRTVPELLVKLSHINENVRLDAISSLDEILFPADAINQSELRINLSGIVRKLCVVLCDVSVQVRNRTCSLFGKVCSAVAEKDFEGLFELFVAHLCNALTHVDEGIQRSALKLLFQVFEHYSRLAVVHGNKILPVLVHILAPLPAAPKINSRQGSSGDNREKCASMVQYARMCNVDDLDRQTAVMQQVHLYLFKVCQQREREDTCAITNLGFLEEDAQTKESHPLFIDYLTPSSITLQTLLSSTVDSDDLERSEISTSMTTLVNVLFQIWISVNQSLSENVSDPNVYDRCLQSLYCTLEVLHCVIQLQQRPTLKIKFNLNIDLLTSNLCRYVLGSFPYRTNLRGQTLQFGRKLNSCVLTVCTLPCMRKSPEVLLYSEVLLQHLITDLKRQFDDPDLSESGKTLDLAKSLIENCSQEKQKLFVDGLLRNLETVRLCEDDCFELILFLSLIFDSLDESSKVRLENLLLEFSGCKDKLGTIILRLFLNLIERKVDQEFLALIPKFLAAVLLKPTMLHMSNRRTYLQCLTFYGLDFGSLTREKFFKIAECLNQMCMEAGDNLGSELIEIMKIACCHCRAAQFQFLKIIIFLQVLRERRKEELSQNLVAFTHWLKSQTNQTCLSLSMTAYEKKRLEEQLIEDLKLFGDSKKTKTLRSTVKTFLD